MRPEIVRKFSARVPRYTSYPTAQSFHSGITAYDYATWLSELPAEENISIYVHIPFCDTLCWYCGCTTKMVKRYDPLPPYLNAVKREIAQVSTLLERKQPVRHIHWGGGSPNILSPDDIRGLSAAIRENFNILPDAEFAVEIDPRQYDPAKVDAFADAGVNRVSLGVQDFSIKVQHAINRVQSFEDTRKAASAFRAKGVKSLNIDLVYGLPYQTRATVQDTIGKVLELDPDRIALFGYAHMPSRAAHQRMINSEALPDVIERYAQANRAAHLLQSAGYVRIGLDHFAKPTDPLAMAPVQRNFQGYTSDDAQTLIGLGASSIGTFPQGYVQNEVATGHYIMRINNGGLATARGIALTEDDRARAFVINRLMCDMKFPAAEVVEKFGALGRSLVEDAQAVLEADDEQLMEPSADGFTITEKGRPFLRSICACFDAHLESGPEARFSVGV